MTYAIYVRGLMWHAFTRAKRVCVFMKEKKTYYFYFILYSSRRIADAVYVRDCNTSCVYDGDGGVSGALQVH